MASPLGALGWRGHFAHDSPQVRELRSELEARAGIRGLQESMIDPSQPGFAEEAARRFHRDGLVVVNAVLSPERLAAVRRAAIHVVSEMVALDPDRLGNRGSHRYSFARAPFQFGCAEEWALLIDPPATSQVVEAIFGSRDARVAFLGGDFVLPGCVQYQGLHHDMRDFLSPAGAKVKLQDLPCPVLAVSYPMELKEGSDVGHSVFNGVTRIVPGSHRWTGPIPSAEEEPEWMKLSVAGPTPAGAAVFWDIRAWHAGTPNLSQEVRAIPGCGFRAPWLSSRIFGSEYAGILSREVFSKLSAAGQRAARELAPTTDHPGGDLQGQVLWAPDWDVTTGKPGNARPGSVNDRPGLAVDSVSPKSRSDSISSKL